jgi:Tol biopolymer transport system component
MMMMRCSRTKGDVCHEECDAAAASGPSRRRPVRGVTRNFAYAALAAALLVPASVLAQASQISLVSFTSLGRPAEGRSDSPATSSDGRFVAFVSNASNILPESGLPEFDVFVRDRELGTIERITVAMNGGDPDRDCNVPPAPTGASGSCLSPAISADGRFVAFASTATNLVEGDENGVADVFVRDRLGGETERISIGFDGSEADGASGAPAISADGRLVAFQSQATNLVPDDTNGQQDIFLFDRETGTTIRVSIGVGEGDEPIEANGASLTPGISGNGLVVAFISSATNLVPNDTNNVPDVFVHVLSGPPPARAFTERVSVSTTGVAANRISFLPKLNFDGTIVAFKSEAFNLVPNDSNGVPDVFVRDRVAGTTERVSVDDFGNQSNSLSGPPSISGDGCHVAFPSAASNLVVDDRNGRMDLFTVDRCRTDLPRVARIGEDLINNPRGPNGDVPDAPPSMSLDGQWVAFASTASDLVPGDTNNEMDVFISGNPLNPPGTEPTPTPTQTPTETPDGFCEDDEDCPPGQVCDPETNRCVTVTPTPTITPTPDGFCEDDEDCPPGQVCDLETNRCVTVTPTPTITPTPDGFCDDDEDCPPGQVCDPTTNRCVTPSPTRTPPGFCDDDEDCPPGQVCDPTTNMCVTPSPTPTPPGFCDDDEDCPPGQVCDPTTNMCVTPSPTPTPPGFCDDDEDCPPGQVCDPETNMCVPRGDGGGGGGCSCEIHPSARKENSVEPLALLLPALALWLRRRALRRR